jgi:hypothetical protein
MTSRLLHDPPYHGQDEAMRSLRLFAETVMLEFRR